MPDYKYAVVVVTYNRLELLKECLGHVVNQTVRPISVVVIDNCSSDGTTEYLKKTYSDTPGFVIIHEEENTGGAGGFCAGLKAAVSDTDADWFMLIDDDAILDYDCMEKLSPDTSPAGHLAYACTVLTDGEISTDHRRYEDESVPPMTYSQKEFPCKYATFCGLMVHRRLVEKIGYPEARYFIWYDDTEYSMRINRYSDIYVRTDARLNHKTKPEPVLKGYKRAIWKDYYGRRNLIHAQKKHKKYLLLAKTIKRTVVKIFKLLLAGVSDRECLTEARLYRDAMIDGLRGRLGRNAGYLPGGN